MYFGLALFTILLYLRPMDFFPVLSPLHLTRSIAIITFLVLFFQKKGREKRLLFADSKQTQWMSTLFVVIILSMLTSIWRSKTAGGIVSFVKIYLGYILIINLITDLKRFKHLTTIMVICGFILAALAIKGYHNNTVIISQGRMFASFSGLIGDPNDFAQILLMLIPFSYIWFFQKTSFLKKLLAIAAITTFLYAIVLTESRGGLLGLSVIGFLIFLKSKKKIGIAILVICAGLLFWNMAPDNYKARISTIRVANVEDESAIGRLNAWHGGWNMMTHRIFGVGAGNFGEGFVKYRPENAIDPLGKRRAAHNMFVQIGGETGFPGLLAFIMLLISSFKSCNRTKKALKDQDSADAKELSLLTDATFISLSAFCVAGFFLSQVYSWFLYYLIAFSVVIEHLSQNLIEGMPESQSAQEAKSKKTVDLGTCALGNLKKWKSRAESGKLNED